MVSVGVALRVRQWWHAPAFWVDELLLLQAIERQRFAELLQPLQNDQSAPPGWLAVQHVLVGLTGADERGARLLPLLLGAGTVVLAAVLARALLGGPAALAGTVLVATSPALVRYSAELKQYSSDGFWVLLLLLAGSRVALAPDSPDRVRPDRDRLVLAGVAAAAVWFSHAGALATGGVLLAVGLRALTRRRWRELAGFVLAGLPAAAGLAVQYVTLLSADAGNTVLQRYWTAAFPAGPLTPGTAADWFAGRVGAVAADPVGWPVRAWVLVLVLAGLVALAARRPAAAAVLVLAVGAVAAAGLAGAYPLSGRLALFAVAPAALLAAAALDLPALLPRLPRAPLPGLALPGLALLGLAVLGLAVLAIPAVQRSGAAVVRPYEREEVRPVLSAVAADRRPGDLVLVDGYGGRYAAAFYGPRSGLGPYTLLQVDRARCGDGGLDPALAGARRVWLVTVHARSADELDYRRRLEAVGRPSRTVTAAGATATRYDRPTGPAAAPTAPTAPSAPARCVRAVAGAG